MKILIIGNGIAGSTAARFIRKMSDHEVIMISDESEFPFSRTALMYIYMGRLKFEHTKLYEDWFWDKNNIQRVFATVKTINTATKHVILSNNSTLNYDKLVLATGSKPNKYGWKGQNLQGVRGLYHKQDLDYLEEKSKNIKRAVIVGGGLIGVEMAEMFHSRHIPVTFLVRENSFWNGVLPTEESEMINRHIREKGIDLRLSTELDEILGDENGNVKAILTKNGEKIACDYVGVTVGVSPNIDFLKDSDIETNRGILIDDFLETSVKDVFAVGDCAELRQPKTGRRAIEAIWYTARMMGQTVAHTICDKKMLYEPKIWFNSAKFFDIEYQIYGNVPTKVDEKFQHLYWQHPDGKKSIRLVFEKSSDAIVGFNLMGIRYRHEVCEKWLSERTPIKTVLANLKRANFDPEFFEKYENKLFL